MKFWCMYELIYAIKRGEETITWSWAKISKKGKKQQKQQISKLVKQKLLIFLPTSIWSIDMALVHCNTYFCLYSHFLMWKKCISSYVKIDPPGGRKTTWDKIGTFGGRVGNQICSKSSIFNFGAYKCSGARKWVKKFSENLK